MTKIFYAITCWAAVLTVGVAGAFEPTQNNRTNGIGNVWGSRTSNLDPLWSVDVGAVFLRRESTNFDTNFEPFDFGFEAGVDADIRRRIGDGNHLQVRYFGVDSWSDQPTALIPTPAFHNYESSLHSTEINLRSQRSDWLTLLGGFRWVELQDSRYFNANPNNPNSNEVDIVNQNQMYGGQLGTDILLWDRGGPLTVNTELKAGIFSNRAKSYRERLASPGAQIPPVGMQEDRSYQTAFVGDLGVNAKYRLTDRLAVRGGYQLMWVEGLSLADAYGDRFNTDTTIDTTGGLFYYGATVGLELSW